MSKKQITLGPSKKYKEVDDIIDSWVSDEKAEKGSVLKDPVAKKTSENSVRTSISIPTSLHKVLRQKSFEDGVTMNQIILKIIEKEFPIKSKP